jgi:hypothetical protein
MGDRENSYCVLSIESKYIKEPTSSAFICLRMSKQSLRQAQQLWAMLSLIFDKVFLKEARAPSSSSSVIGLARLHSTRAARL